MYKIRKFNATDIEFKQLAKIDNLVNHDSINHPDDDKREWKIRDKNLVRDRLLLYYNSQIIGVLYYNQGRDSNNKITFFTLHINPEFNTEKTRNLLFNKFLMKSQNIIPIKL